MALSLHRYIPHHGPAPRAWPKLFFAWGCFRNFVRRGRPAQALTVACENTTSISVPERAPVLIWNLARLASTSAFVSDRLTAAPSLAWSDGAAVRNGSSAAATSLSLRPWP